MASNRTMDMALGKAGKKPMATDEQDDESAEMTPDDESAEGEDPDEKKAAFMDMCKNIRAGKDEKAYELYQDICEGM